MNYNDWLEAVPESITNDALWKEELPNHTTSDIFTNTPMP